MFDDDGTLVISFGNGYYRGYKVLMAEAATPT